MFWGSFLYYLRGPCYIYKKETPKIKKEAAIVVEQMNLSIEEEKKVEWELETGMRRVGLRTKPSKKPVWKWDKKHGKLVREGKGGINWYRY
jgi:hypothetical protein